MNKKPDTKKTTSMDVQLAKAEQENRELRKHVKSMKYLVDKSEQAVEDVRAISHAAQDMTLAQLETAREFSRSPSPLARGYAIVNGARQQDYGNPVYSFKLIAQAASISCGRTLSAADCCRVLMAVKQVRESFKHNVDNLVDLAGYTDILAKIIEYEQQRIAAMNSLGMHAGNKPILSPNEPLTR